MLRRQNLFSSFTFWLLPFALLLVFLQTQPGIGVVLMFLGPPINIALAYILVGAFILDCLIGPFPFMALLAALAGLAGFGIWYAVESGRDRAAIPAIEAELQSRNTGTTFPFDPSSAALVYSDNYVLLRYDLSAVYDFGEQRATRYVRFGIKARRLCKNTQYVAGASEYLVTNSQGASWCLTRTDLDPRVPLVTVESQDEPKETIAGHEVSLYRLTAKYNGDAVGHLVGASVNLLAGFPVPVFSCGLVDQPPAWKCFFYWGRQETTLDTLPGPPRSQDGDNLGVLLGLKPRSGAEIADLTAK